MKTEFKSKFYFLMPTFPQQIAELLFYSIPLRECPLGFFVVVMMWVESLETDFDLRL